MKIRLLLILLISLLLGEAQVRAVARKSVSENTSSGRSIIFSQLKSGEKIRFRTASQWFQENTAVLTKPAVPPIVTNLEVKHVASPGPYKLGSNVVYTITLKNLGPEEDKNVNLTLELLAGQTYVSHTISTGDVFVPAGNIGKLHLNRFAVGAQVVLQVTSKINTPEFNPSIVTVLSDSEDPDTKNNSSELNLCVLTEAPGGINGPAYVCSNSTGNVFKAIPVTGARKYKWTVPDGWVITSGTEGETITVTANNASGTGTLTVKAVNGCGESLAASTTVKMGVMPPAMPGDIVGESLLCAGTTNLKYTVPPVLDADSYEWILPADWTLVSGEGTNAITVTAGLISGKIQVRAVNKCGESDYRSSIVAVVPSIPPVPEKIQGPAGVCKSGTRVTYSVAAVANAFEYKWSVPSGWKITKGLGTRQIEVELGTESGIVSVAAENICGVSDQATLSVTVSETIPVLSAITGESSVCTTNNAYTYSVEPVLGVTEYIWQLPAGWILVSGDKSNKITVRPTASGGTIQVLATNMCGTGKAVTLAVTAHATPPSTPGAITGWAVPCVQQQKLEYSVPSVAGAETYHWTIPADWTFVGDKTSNKIVVNAGSSSGQIQVYASNSCGDSAPVSLTINPSQNIPTAPESIQGEAAPCITNLQQTYSVQNPVAGLVYKWTYPSNWTVVSQSASSIQLNVASAGSISVTASNGCGVSPATALAVTPTTSTAPLLAEIEGVSTACADEVVSFSVNPAGGVYTYQWQVPSGWNIISGAGTSKIEVKVGISSGEVTLTAGNGCVAPTTKRMPVKVFPRIVTAPGPITGSTQVCESVGNLTYSIAPVAGAERYEWTLPQGWSFVAGEGTTSVTVKPGATSGNIQVVASNSGCGRSSAATTAVQVTPALTPLIGKVTGKAGPCLSTTQTYTVPALSGVTYQWTYPNDWILQSGQGTNSVTLIVGKSSGEVAVRLENACKDVATSLLFAQVQSGTPVLGTLEGLAQPCVGNASTQYQIAAVPGATYAWSVPTGWTILEGRTTNTITVNPGSRAGRVTVEVTNDCGAKASTSLEVSPVTTGPTVPVSIIGAVAPCVNEAQQTYRIQNPVVGMKYTWSIPTGWTLVSGQGSSELQVNAPVAGTLSVVANNGCANSTPATLQVTPGNSEPVFTQGISGPAAVCGTTPTVKFSVAASDKVNAYEWQVPTGWTITSGKGTSEITVAVGSTSGEVTVTGQSGCVSTTKKLAVTVTNAQVSKPEAILGNPAVCAKSGSAVFWVAPVSNAATYEWVLPAGWAFVSGEKTASVTVKPGTKGGKIKLVAKNACGISDTVSMDVQVTPDVPPVLGAITGMPVVCGTSPQTYTVPAIAGVTYQWSIPNGWSFVSGQGTNSITVQAGASGKVSVVAVNGCGSSATASTFGVEVTNGAPVLSDIQGTLVPCIGNATTTYQIAPVAGANSYTWSVPAGWTIISGAGTNKITVAPGANSGTVRVEVLTCSSAVKSIQVSPVASPPAMPGAIMGDAAICGTNATAFYEIAPVPGAESYTWTLPAGWKIISGEGTTKIMVSTTQTSGTVSVKTRNGCGESGTATLAVKVAPALGELKAIQKESTLCSGLSFWVDPVAGATTYTWTVPNGWTINGQGTTHVTLENIKSFTTSVRVSVVASNGVCQSPPVFYEIFPGTLDTEIRVPNAFSPNNDGKNDVWRIQSLLNYPDNEIIVMNRWGSEVYRQKKYQNNWDGGGLAEGTYYYVLRVRLCDNKETTYKGYVTIVR